MYHNDVHFFVFSENSDKFLSDFNIGNGSILKCDDFLQNFELKVIIAHAYVYFISFIVYIFSNY